MFGARRRFNSVIEALDVLRRMRVSFNPDGESDQLRRLRVCNEGNDVTKRPSWAALWVKHVARFRVVIDENWVTLWRNRCSLDKLSSKISRTLNRGIEDVSKRKYNSGGVNPLKAIWEWAFLSTYYQREGITILTGCEIFLVHTQRLFLQVRTTMPASCLYQYPHI